MSRGARVAALGLVLCLLAGAFGVASLYVPGLALMLLAAGAETSVRLASRSARIEREPLDASAVEGVSLRVSTLLLGGRFPLGGGELSRWPGAAFEPLRRRSPGRIDFTARLERRGRHVIGPSLLRFRDPFGICARSLLSPSTDVLVLPRVERISTEELSRVAGLGRDARRRPSAAPAAEVDGLRAYRRGAPASRIHWPTVARTGTLVERRLRAESDRVPLVVIDAQSPASTEALDMGVRAAASLCVGLAGLGGCSLLLPGARRAHGIDANLGSWPAMHARLALVEPGAAPAWTAIERAAIVLWVTASARPSSAIGRLGAGAHYTVSPFPIEGRAVLFAVAGCAVQAAIRAGAARAA